jgi:hypothetical protein
MHTCHAEHREASLFVGREIFHFAQDDRLLLLTAGKVIHRVEDTYHLAKDIIKN